MENECEALPGVAYPGLRDNRSTINTNTGYDDDDDLSCILWFEITPFVTTPMHVQDVKRGWGRQYKRILTVA